MKRMGRLRVDAIYEIIGLDAVMHEEVEKFDYVSQNAIRVAEIGKKAKARAELYAQGRGSLFVNTGESPKPASYGNGKVQINAYTRRGRRIKQPEERKEDNWANVGRP